MTDPTTLRARTSGIPRLGMVEAGRAFAALAVVLFHTDTVVHAQGVVTHLVFEKRIARWLARRPTSSPVAPKPPYRSALS